MKLYKKDDGLWYFFSDRDCSEKGPFTSSAEALQEYERSEDSARNPLYEILYNRRLCK